MERAAQKGSEARDLTLEIPALVALANEPEAASPLVEAGSPTSGPLAPAVVAPAAIPGPAAMPVPRSRRSPARWTGEHVATRSSLVRVDFAQLDHLLNLVGELIVYRTKLQELGKQASQLLAGPRARATCLTRCST